MAGKFLRISLILGSVLLLSVVVLLVKQLFLWDDYHTPNFSGIVSGPAELQRAVMFQKSYYLMQDEDFSGALSLITGNDGYSHYQRGLVGLLWANSLVETKEYGKLYESQAKLATADQSFELAEQLLPQDLSKKVSVSHQALRQLQPVATIKTCVVGYDTLVGDLQFLGTAYVDLQGVVAKQQSLVRAKKAFLDKISKGCYDQLTTLLDAHQNQFSGLVGIFGNHAVTYSSVFADILKQPENCLDNDVSSLVFPLQHTTESLSGYKQYHDQLRSLLIEQNASELQALCEQVKNDQQLYDAMQSSLDEALQALDQDVGERQFGQGQVEYEALDDTQIDVLLDRVYQQQYQILDDFSRVKKNPHYSNEGLLDKLFDEFFGNTGDFQ